MGGGRCSEDGACWLERVCEGEEREVVVVALGWEEL